MRTYRYIKTRKTSEVDFINLVSKCVRIGISFSYDSEQGFVETINISDYDKKELDLFIKQNGVDLESVEK